MWAYTVATPFSPTGRRCRQADEGVPAKATKIHEFKSVSPLIRPFGPPSPQGEKELPVLIHPYAIASPAARMSRQ